MKSLDQIKAQLESGEAVKATCASGMGGIFTVTVERIEGERLHVITDPKPNDTRLRFSQRLDQLTFIQG